jgi:adenosylcobinamide-GDP ribazoletransferase
MIRQIELFLIAIQFFTRIPIPTVNYTPEKLNSSSKYFPLVGVLVGVLVSLSYMVSTFIFSHSISILISIFFSLILTGAFHEDGLSDFIDGMGGGYTKEKILQIMKDSRIGSFGAIAITMYLLFKFFSLNEISSANLPLVFVSAHSLSRFVSISLIYSLNYVSEEGKSKPLANKIKLHELLLAFLFGLAPLLSFQSFYIFILLVPQFLFRIFFSYYLDSKIKGYTGDSLGAAQEFSEIIFYLSFIGLTKWISI